MRTKAVTEEERRLQGELPGFLELLGEVAGWLGGLDMAKAAELPPESLSGLRDGLLRALEFLHALFAHRGEPPPAPEPGVAYAALGPGLRRTLPQRLAAQLADELNAVPGRRLEDVSQFTALGLFARVTDLLRFVRFLEGERGSAARAAAPPTVASSRRQARRASGAVPVVKDVRPARASVSPPAPDGPGPDLSAYEIRIDEAGERIDLEGLSVWLAASPGPRAAGGGLAAAFAVPVPGGVALAVSDGAESSLGARYAAVLAARTFCRAAAANPADAGAAVAVVQHHLEVLLSALLAAGDSAESLGRIRGNVPAANARRILHHTREPEEALRRVAPALTTGLLGAVVTRGPDGVRVSLHRVGTGSAEARASGRVAPLLGGSRTASAALLGPGARGLEALALVESPPLVRLVPGEALLLATPAVAKGAASAWAGLSTLWAPFPDGLSTGDSARDLLRRAERWGEAEPPSFAGPLGYALLLVR